MIDPLNARHEDLADLAERLVGEQHVRVVFGQLNHDFNRELGQKKQSTQALVEEARQVLAARLVFHGLQTEVEVMHSQPSHPNWPNSVDVQAMVSLRGYHFFCPNLAVIPPHDARPMIDHLTAGEVVYVSTVIRHARRPQQAAERLIRQALETVTTGRLTTSFLIKDKEDEWTKIIIRPSSR